MEFAPNKVVYVADIETGEPVGPFTCALHLGLYQEAVGAWGGEMEYDTLTEEYRCHDFDDGTPRKFGSVAEANAYYNELAK